jgi:hypothetical protein
VETLKKQTVLVQYNTAVMIDTPEPSGTLIQGAKTVVNSNTMMVKQSVSGYEFILFL